ncbi:Bromodomain-containing protein 8 [Dermatophagoides pteronyssinus]|uniref:Bromodomain-containing protein 8 n=1 Tax=Dermatophagoides pteronyssinus TaxID=6956 RepID=A0ABQ8IX31_DERPT|nr:Bromodomain-containing protein 8 [Dermatophagoides pteronyssinus]
MASYDRQRLRLKQEPIDEWSTQEKLVLASGVQKIGNQNWGPIVRHLKSFAEKDRPSDWFNPKFCALQYNDMFDKIEAPKRKRGERGEETTQDLIVKKYSTERMNELEQGMKEKFKEMKNLNKILDKLKSSDYDRNYLQKLSTDIKKREQQKKDEENEYQKWLAEREMRLSQISMKFRSGSTPITNRQSSIRGGDSMAAKEKPPTTTTPMAEKTVDIEKEKLPENEISENISVENNNNKTDNIDDTEPIDNQTSSTSIVQNQASIISPKTENNSETELISERNKNDDIKPSIEIDEKTNENHSTKTTNTTTTSKIETTVDIESDSASSNYKDNVENEPTNITIEMTNDESCETNETVFDDGIVSSTESKTEDNSGGRISTTEQKIISEIKPDLHTDSSMDIVESPAPHNTKDNVDNSIKIDSELMDDKNIVKIEQQQQNDQSQESISTPNNDKNNSRQRKRRRLNTSNTSNNVIQTRSTRSTAHHSVEQQQQQQNESITVMKKEDETLKPTTTATKKRTSSTNEESSNTFVNYSEESNDSKSVISEPAGSTSSRTANDNNDSDAKWKKASSAIIRAIQNHRYAQLVLKPFENNDEYRDAIYQDIDLNATKKRIESGQIRNESEFKRDLMLMFTNGIILNTEPNIIKSIMEFAKETIDLFDTTETTKIKTREKYHTTLEVEKNSRRQTRGSVMNENEKLSRSGKKISSSTSTN